MEEKRAYLVTTVSGRVFLAVVDGRNPDHGDKQAMTAVQDHCPEEIWDTSSFPNAKSYPYGVSEVSTPVLLPARKVGPHPPVPKTALIEENTYYGPTR